LVTDKDGKSDKFQTDSENEIRKLEVEIVQSQIEDSKDSRSVAKALLVKIAQQVNLGERVVDGETVQMVNTLTRTFGEIQKQQQIILAGKVDDPVSNFEAVRKAYKLRGRGPRK